jgi:hypothetical protein
LQFLWWRVAVVVAVALTVAATIWVVAVAVLAVLL